MENSKIEWTDHTFSPWLGCTKVSAGCTNCYAETLTTRYKWAKWGPGETRKRTSVANWKKPLTWNRKAEKAGVRRRVFCASLCDVFDHEAPAGARADLWDLIRKCPELDWQLLTKRPENIEQYLPADWYHYHGWPNVWLGTTTEDQAAYDLRWPILSGIYAAVHFISYEPAIGPLIDGRVHYRPGLDHHRRGKRERRAHHESAVGSTPCRTVRLSLNPGLSQTVGHLQEQPDRLRARDEPPWPPSTYDPPSNGKGGGLIDGRLLREFP